MKDNALLCVAAPAHRSGLTPNKLTSLGLCFGVMSGILFVYKAVPLALLVGFLSASCDMLDGTVARVFRLKTTFGLVFDSVADRVSEIAVVLGALFGGIIEPLGIIAVVGSISLLLSRTLSYIQGLSTDYVLFGRVVRLVLILFGLISPITSASTLCFVIAGALSIVSSFQIIIYLCRSRILLVQPNQNQRIKSKVSLQEKGREGPLDDSEAGIIRRSRP